MNANKIVLLHAYSYLDGIHWFWTIVAAGGIPCLSSPFSKDDKHRVKHIKMLQELLNNPTIITSDKFANGFKGVDNLQLWAFEKIDKCRDTLLTYAAIAPPSPTSNIKGSDIVVLMLTSRSLRNSKAVQLSHSQILASIEAKNRLTHNATSTNSEATRVINRNATSKFIIMLLFTVTSMSPPRLPASTSINRSTSTKSFRQKLKVFIRKSLKGIYLETSNMANAAAAGINFMISPA